MDKLKLILLGLRIFLLDWWGDRWERYIERRFKITGRLSERRVLFVYRRLSTPARTRQYELIARFDALKEVILEERNDESRD